MKKHSMLILFMFTLITLTSGICYSAETGIISGKVVDEKTGEGLGGTFVTINGENPKRSYASQTTDEHGKYSAKYLPPGKYTVEAIRRSNDYCKITREGVKCTAGKTTTLNFEMKSANYGISGIVTDISTGAPIKEARIILESSKLSELGSTADEHGKFNFIIIPRGVYTVKAVADGYETKYLTDIIHEPGKEKFLSINLEPVHEILTRTFPVKYLPVIEILKRIRILSSKEGTIIPGSNSLIITDTKENLVKIGNIITQLDIPPVQIQLEVKLLIASPDNEKKSKIPGELDNIAKQLKALFRYKNYELLDDARYVALENEGGSFIIGKGVYLVMIDSVDFLDVNGGLIKLQRFMLTEGGKKTVLSTTVNIPNGDTVILGASNVDLSGRALIIAVTAKTMKL